MKRIEVAVGLVFNDVGDVLVGQRRVKDQYYQKWEFPGGKLELGETPHQALVRELAEEVGILVAASDEFMTLMHDYSDRSVKLFVRKVISFTGEVTSMEGQAIKWQQLRLLSELDFLAGNQVIIDQLLDGLA